MESQRTACGALPAGMVGTNSGSKERRAELGAGLVQSCSLGKGAVGTWQRCGKDAALRQLDDGLDQGSGGGGLGFGSGMKLRRRGVISDGLGCDTVFDEVGSNFESRGVLACVAGLEEEDVEVLAVTMSGIMHVSRGVPIAVDASLSASEESSQLSLDCRKTRMSSRSSSQASSGGCESSVASTARRASSFPTNRLGVALASRGGL